MRQLVTFLVIFSALHSVQTQSETNANEFCTLPPVEGTSADGTFSIYLHYNKTQDKCFPFKYFGTGGNNNRFEAEKYCMRNCSESAKTLYPTDEREACHLPKVVGKCMSQYLRYYYDSVHDKCKIFFWTGCVGNGNRFLDAQACNNTCYGIHDEGDFEEEEELDTPVALILGLILSLIGVTIIVVFTLLAVMSRPIKKSKKAPKEDTVRQPMQEDRIEMKE